MRPSRGMGIIAPSKQPKKIRRKDGATLDMYSAGGDTGSRVNEAGNYTKPGMRKSLFNKIKNSATQGTAAGQ